MSRSPWQRVLGDELADLDASLRAYFSAIPEGCVGRGEGVFHRVGTPRRWLWPVFAVLARDGILFPGWERDVPFTVVNRPTAHGAVRATRTFHFRRGDRVMCDEIGVTRAGLTDRLGIRGLVSAVFDAKVIDGGLELRSTRTELRLGPVRIPFAARVSLVERTDGDRQHVDVRLSLPVVGPLYEYSGSFRYRLEEDARG